MGSTETGQTTAHATHASDKLPSVSAYGGMLASLGSLVTDGLRLTAYLVRLSCFTAKNLCYTCLTSQASATGLSQVQNLLCVPSAVLLDCIGIQRMQCASRRKVSSSPSTRERARMPVKACTVALTQQAGTLLLLGTCTCSQTSSASSRCFRQGGATCMHGLCAASASASMPHS